MIVLDVREIKLDKPFYNRAYIHWLVSERDIQIADGFCARIRLVVRDGVQIMRLEVWTH